MKQISATADARTRNRVDAKTQSIIQLLREEKALTLTGLLGFLLAGVCGIWVLIFGETVPPDGNVLHAFSFDAALGLFLLSTAAIAPFSGLGAKGRMFFRRSFILLALYSFFAETVQNMRGMNPRFVKSDALFDVIVSSIFTFVALLLILCYLYLSIQFFKKKVYTLNPEMALGTKYAMIAVVVSFAAGIWISINQGRMVGGHGNIIWLHGLGFHALQAVPIVAWLAGRSAIPNGSRSKFIHFTGIAYLLGLTAIAWQTYLGNNILEWSALPLIACGCFLVSLAAGSIVLRKSLIGFRRQTFHH